MASPRLIPAYGYRRGWLSALVVLADKVKVDIDRASMAPELR